MVEWGTKKWGSTSWGNSVPPQSENALLRAVVGGNNDWVPVPAVGAPNGGDPVTGAALYRHAVTHVYLIDEDWNTLTELVGLTDGTCTRSLSGPLQQDTLNLTLWDPTDYYTDGKGALLVYDGNLVKVVMEIKSPGGVLVAPLGVYRLMGFPTVKRTKVGTQLILNGVEWWRPQLSLPFQGGTCPKPTPEWVFSSGADSDFAGSAWPSTTSSLDEAIFSINTCDDDYVAWAETMFTNKQTQDFGDGNGPQPVWLLAPYAGATAAFWKMLDINLHPDRLIVDKNLRDPYGGFFNGKPSGTTSLGPEFLIRTPEWREVLGQLSTTSPYWAVMDGNGRVHMRNPGGRYITPFIISCDPDVGGTIAMPVEEVDRTTGQPEFTEVLTYTQVNPVVGDQTGKVFRSGSFRLRSHSKVPERYTAFGPRREVIIYDTESPPPAHEGAGGDPVDISDPPGPWIDDKTSIPRLYEIMSAADTLNISLDSAFPYIKLGDEIRVAMPGIRGFFTVTSITQPFSTSAMTITASWREDG